jgi:hypothetical protein
MLRLPAGREHDGVAPAPNDGMSAALHASMPPPSTTFVTTIGACTQEHVTLLLAALACQTRMLTLGLPHHLQSTRLPG